MQSSKNKCAGKPPTMVVILQTVIEEAIPNYGCNAPNTVALEQTTRSNAPNTVVLEQTTAKLPGETLPTQQTTWSKLHPFCSLNCKE